MTSKTSLSFSSPSPWLRAGLLAAISLLICGAALAQTTIDTLAGAGCGLSPFGQSGTQTYGQTVTVPLADTALQSFTFEMNLPSTVVFRGQVFAWDGDSATGTALYTSAPTSTAGAGYQTVTFNTGSLNLTAGAQYVLFATTVNDAGSGQGPWRMHCGGDQYAGGTAVYLNHSTPAELTTQSWTVTSPDLAFQAVFGPATLTSADLSVTKSTTSSAVRRGENITYTIGVTNSGPDAAANVVLSDTLPAGTTFQSITEPAGFTCTTPGVGATGTVTCTAATLANGATATFTLVLGTSATIASDTMIVNSASVTSAAGDTDPADNAATAPAVAVDVVPVPTASEWALLSMLLVLGAIAVLKLR